MNHSSISQVWGLYGKDNNNQITIPLKSLDINIQIVHNVARVLYTQVYYNESQHLLETEFFFPTSPDACFDSFEAKFNDTVIKGVVKENEEAKAQYQEAVSLGKTVAYSEINEDTGDIMKIMIGNIPQNTEISITYSYIQQLETSLNKFWCFRLFSTITPRYNGGLQQLIDEDLQLLASYPTISKNDKDSYPWTIKVEIQSPSPITFIQSPSHQIISQYGNENHTCSITLNPETKHFPNKDFVLLFTNGKENEKADYVLTPFEDGYCAMVSLFADFDKASIENAYDNFVKAKKTESKHVMDTIRGEYIFLLDRSGSMDGERITMAKNSLLLFLKSLPKESYMNVVSFGTGSSFLRGDSVAYSQESLELFTKEIEKFEADMGGTEIYNALKTVFDLPQKKNHPRFVFLLTDGDVSNTNSVLELINSNSDKARVFTIGIGNGCSPQLITKGALYGRGKHEFVTDNNQTYEKVIGLLNASLSPCYSDFSLESNNFDAVVESVSPNPATVPFLLNGQTITFFLFLREEAFNENQKMRLSLKLFDSRIGDYRKIEIVLDKENLYENELVPKLAIFDMLKRLETAEKDMKNKSDLFIVNYKTDIKKNLLELSLKYGILCKETAFYCEIKENNTLLNTTMATRAKITVPTIQSNDYSSSIRFRNISSSRRSGSPSNQARTWSDQDQILQQIDDSLSCLASKSQYIGSSLREQSERLRPPSILAQAKPKEEGFFSKIKDGITSLFSKEKEQSPPRIKSKIGAAPSTSTKKMEESKSIPESTTSKGSFDLNVIMKQTFDGYWKSDDQTLINKVLKDNKLPDIPKEINPKTAGLLKEAWMTILILLWLEVFCSKDKGAWELIHQKGVEWLGSQGVDYEKVKQLGTPFIKS